MGTKRKTLCSLIFYTTDVTLDSSERTSLNQYQGDPLMRQSISIKKLLPCLLLAAITAIFSFSFAQAATGGPDEDLQRVFGKVRELVQEQKFDDAVKELKNFSKARNN